MISLSEIIEYLRPDAKYSIVGDTVVWADTEQVVPTTDDIEVARVELENSNTIRIYVEKIDDIIDELTIDAKTIIAGRKVSEEQLMRYRDKYDVAKEFVAGNTGDERLVLEASLVGVSTYDIAGRIIVAGDLYIDNMRTRGMLLDAIRVKTMEYIESNSYTIVDQILEYTNTINYLTTTDDVIAFFNTLG